ncbi:MAG: hypothetical protein ACI4RH_01300 [Huintestinicola sp.]
MKIKKLIPLLFAAVCLTACAQIPPVKEPVPEEQQTVITPPEDGWTAEELMSVSYINNYSLSYPLTLESFGGGVSFVPINLYSDNEEERVFWYFISCYDIKTDQWGSSHVTVSYGRTEDNATADEPVAKLRCYSDFTSINGVKRDLPEEDIEKLLGKPDRIDEDHEFLKKYIYCDRESGNELINVKVNKESKIVSDVKITF